MQKVEELKTKALEYMRDSGFPIREKITVAVDDKLPFMGYTTEQNGKPHIVIAKWALATEMVMGLLIHELSHVYRIETNHPSHNGRIHNKILRSIFKNTHIHEYQEEILRNTINNLQDLYADDMSFAVYKAHLTLSSLNEFFLGWIRPVVSPTTEQKRWQNAGALLNAAFAQANIERHEITDTGNKIEKAEKAFLQKCDPKIAKKFDHFKNIMVTLPDPITDKDFEKLLRGYIKGFLKLTIHS